MTEERQPIPGWEGIYDVSSAGVVRSLTRIVSVGTALRQLHERVLRPVTRRNGYLSVNLYRNNKATSADVHRLVALSFMPRVDGMSLHVRHMDGDKQNNHAGNLRWGTRSDNEKDKIAHGKSRIAAISRATAHLRAGERAYNCVLSNAQVAEIRASTERIAVLSRRYNVSQSQISRVRNLLQRKEYKG
jgi:hypothetical protein